MLGSGLLLAGTTAVLPLFGGGEILEVGTAALSIPLLGDIRLSSALVFDTGVYLVVVGVVLMAFEAFGEDRTEGAVA